MEYRATAKETAERLTKLRGSVYGDPANQLRCAAELKAVYRKYRPFDDSRYLAHDEAMESVLLKVSRIACGAYHADNYDDILGYGKIAKEVHPNADAAKEVRFDASQE